MPMFDLPLAQLQSYVPPRDEPADFAAFWAKTLAEARQFPIEARFERVETGYTLIETYDVTFNGFGGQPIKAWFVLPANARDPLPCMVQYHGYSCGRGHAQDYWGWAAAGYANLIMDNRGQSGHYRGDTPDLPVLPSSPHFAGWMTQGISDPYTYYYRRLFTDAVRAVEAARAHPLVNAKRIGVCGGSQGGGISLAVAGLDASIALALVDVPFLCHYRVATEIVDTAPYNEISRYCHYNRDRIENTFATLRYFDGVNFAAHATAETLFSVGLMDDICPPRTVFAAYNHYAAAKQIEVYPYGGHDGGGHDHDRKKMAFVNARWRS
jgi:cephalosporin-C deacetylase